MNKVLIKKGVFMFIGSMILPISALFLYEVFPFFPDVLVPASFAAYALFIISCRYFAKAKARNPAWGWFGLLGFLGLIVFVILKDYNQKWYYQHNDESIGPIAVPDIISLITAETIDRDTLVWKIGSKKWKLASRVFRKNFINSPPPPPSILSKNIPKEPRPDAPLESNYLDNWSNSAMTGLIVGSIIFPIIGIILGIVYLSNSATSLERKTQSKLLLIIGASVLVILGFLSFVSATIYQAFMSTY